MPSFFFCPACYITIGMEYNPVGERIPSMTKRLYYESAYHTEWETRIIGIRNKEDGLYVMLEESAFYPHGGGQPCDVGTIGGIPVLDVVGEGGDLLHKVERRPEQETVICRLDWDRRFDHMQQHSGQHLLSAVCLQLFEAPTVSFHLGDDSCTIDVAVPELSADQLACIEREVNRQIYRNRKITGYFVTEAELSRLTLVKPAAVTDRIRIVEINGVEYNACGGTHVSSTGEIGMIKLLKGERMKGNTRIYFLCGGRALEEFRSCLGILGVLASKFNTGREGITDRFEKWETEHRALQTELARLKMENEEYMIRELLRENAGTVMIARSYEDKSLKELQSLAGKLTAEAEVPVLLASAAENKVVLASPAGSGLACGPFMKEHLAAFGGKGGGSGNLAQAGFASREDAEAFYAFAKGELTGANWSMKPLE